MLGRLSGKRRRPLCSVSLKAEYGKVMDGLDSLRVDYNSGDKKAAKVNGSPGELRAAEGCNTPDTVTDFRRMQYPEGAAIILRNGGETSRGERLVTSQQEFFGRETLWRVETP